MDYSEKVLQVATALLAAKIGRGHVIGRLERNAAIDEAKALVKEVKEATEGEVTP